MDPLEDILNELIEASELIRTFKMTHPPDELHECSFRLIASLDQMVDSWCARLMFPQMVKYN